MHADNMSKKAVKFISIIFVLIMLLTLLIACDAQTYKHRLENKGYTVFYAEIDEQTVKEFGTLGSQLREYGLSIDDVKWAMLGMEPIKGEDVVTIYHFKNKDTANIFYTKFSEELKDENEHLEIDKKDVFYGTEKGIKDARTR